MYFRSAAALTTFYFIILLTVILNLTNVTAQLTNITAQRDICGNYSVTVRQLDSLRNENMTLRCTYTSTTHVIIRWETKKTDAGGYRTAFTEDVGDSERSEPNTEFVGKVDGGIVDNQTHELTVNDTSEADELNFWRCAVLTKDCYPGGEVGVVIPVFTERRFLSGTILMNGRETYGASNLKAKVSLTIYTLSEPRCTISAKGVSTSTTECQRVEDQLPFVWNCTVSGTLEESADVSFTATLEGESSVVFTSPTAKFVYGESGGGGDNGAVGITGAKTFIIVTILLSTVLL